MSQQNYRSVGAITGMVIGVLAMRSVDQSGIVPLFLFAGGGTVVGGIIGERVYASRRGK